MSDLQIEGVWVHADYRENPKLNLEGVWVQVDYTSHVLAPDPVVAVSSVPAPALSRIFVESAWVQVDYVAGNLLNVESVWVQVDYKTRKGFGVIPSIPTIAGGLDPS